MIPVQIDCGKNVTDVWFSNIKHGENFDFPASRPWIESELSASRNEELLKYLQRYDS